jgi:hypothetical protein
MSLLEVCSIKSYEKSIKCGTALGSFPCLGSNLRADSFLPPKLSAKKIYLYCARISVIGIGELLRCSFDIRASEAQVFLEYFEVLPGIESAQSAIELRAK